MLETKVEGAAGDVEAATNWLRSRLKAAVSTAGDEVQTARSTALDGWEGDAGDAYRGYARGLVIAADELAPVVESRNQVRALRPPLEGLPRSDGELAR